MIRFGCGCSACEEISLLFTQTRAPKDILLHLTEEVGKLVQAYRKGMPHPDIATEAADVLHTLLEFCDEVYIDLGKASADTVRDDFYKRSKNSK